jgi:hypothetical protein
MKNDRPLYIVKPENHRSLDDIYAIFDSQAKSEAFLNRFKTRHKNLKIIVRTINPTFHTDEKTDPYYLAFDKLASHPSDIFICNSIYMAEEARKETYSISFFRETTVQDGIFIYQCMATDQKSAIEKAVLKRTELIDNGDWEKAWNSYNLKNIPITK